MRVEVQPSFPIHVEAQPSFPIHVEAQPSRQSCTRLFMYCVFTYCFCSCDIKLNQRRNLVYLFDVYFATFFLLFLTFFATFLVNINELGEIVAINVEKSSRKK